MTLTKILLLGSAAALVAVASASAADFLPRRQRLLNMLRSVTQPVQAISTFLARTPA